MIWFVRKKGENTTIDYERNSDFMETFGLDIKKAPHIVIIDEHPDKWKSGDKLVDLGLNRLPEQRVYVILAGIAGYIRKKKIPGKQIQLRMVYEASKLWLDDHREDVKDLAGVLAKFMPKGS